MTTLGTAYAHASRRVHLALHRFLDATCWNAGLRRLSSTRGQGTVEYVGIVIVIGVLLVALKTGVAGKHGGQVGEKLSKAVAEAIDTVMKKDG
jgi:hypothetical protein